MGLYSWLMAQGYDLAMRNTEQRCLHQWRRDLMTSATGTLLEIGAGTGINLAHYPISPEMVLCEPDQQMRKQLHKKLAASKHLAQVTDWPAEQIERPDDSVDTIVSTLVLCTVKHQQHALKEIHRVLRPGGQLLFLEHVQSDNQKIARWQKLCNPMWRCVCGNCHLTRPTADNITASGFELEELIDAEMPGTPAIVRRTVRGRARKTSPTVATSVSNQELDLSNPPSCPHCKSTDVAKIIYGKPPLTRQLLEGLESGTIISGGCMIHGGAPQWHCNSCRREFGKQIFTAQT